MSRTRSYAPTSVNELSRRICKSGIRFALSILLGFLRHKRESLNKWEGKEDVGLATSSLAHYSMLPTSGYSSIGCSPAEPISASPDTLCPSDVRWSMIVPLEIRVSTLLNGLTQQAPGIKRFIVFKHGPGHNQHLGG